MEELFSIMKDFLHYCVSYIYPYFIIYILFIIDNYLLFYIIWSFYIILIYIISKNLTKEELNKFILFLMIILLPFTIILFTIKFIFILLNKYILYKILWLEYPFISIRVKKNIKDINNMREQNKNIEEHENISII